MFEALKRGARHSKKDLAMLKEIKAHAVALGAEDTETTDGEGEGKSMEQTPVDAAVKHQPHPYPIKVLASDAETLTVGGYGVVFSGKDLRGDTFQASTDFWLSVMPGEMPRPVLYDHGMDDAVKMFVLGKTVKIEPDETGLWVEAQLERHNRYMKEVEQLIEMGVLGYSSGSVGHLVRYAEADKGSDPLDEWFWGGGTFASWPIFEFSLTPTPAEPRTLGVSQLRSLVEAYPAAKSLLIGARGQGLGARPETVKTVQAQGLNPTPLPLDPTRVSTPSDGGHLEGEGEEEMDEKQVAAIVEAAVEKVKGEFVALLEGQPPTKTAGVAAPFVHVERTEDLTEERAFKLWMRWGNEAPPAVLRYMRRRYSQITGLDMSGDVVKATLAEGTDAQGGYWVPTVYANQVEMPLANQSYLRRAGANIMAGISGTDSFRVPSLTYSGRATIGGEGSAYTPDEPGAGEMEFNPYKLKKLAKATEEMVEDSRYDVWSMILQPDFEQAFAEGENYYFTVGTGTGMPQGVVYGATVGVTSASQTVPSADEIKALVYSVDYKYREDPSCGFMMNDATALVVDKLKDGDGNYLWRESLQVGQPPRLLGFPVYFNQQMATPATGADTILFGAFRYYSIAPWPGLQIQRLNEKYADTGHIGFRAFRRVDGNIMQAAAFRKLRMA